MKVLRRHHFRQQEMSRAIEFLKGIPLCCSYNYSQLAGLAYSMKISGFEKKTVIADAGTLISSVYIVRTGDVWVSKELSESSTSKKTSHMPTLALCILAVGKILGEQDILEGKKTYSSMYKANSDCSLYEVPLEIYRGALKAPSVEYFQTAEVARDLKEASDKRVNRAQNSITSLLLKYSDDVTLKGNLVKILPSVIDTEYTESFSPRTPVEKSQKSESEPAKGHTVNESFESLLGHIEPSLTSYSPQVPPRSARRSTASTSPRVFSAVNGSVTITSNYQFV